MRFVIPSIKRYLSKNKNSALNHSIVTTLLALALVSCKPSATPVSSGSSHPKKMVKEENKAEAEKARRVIITAKSYLGTRYKTGGTSKSGMDCSGLTTTAYKSIHVDLPRTSEEQSHIGQTISLEELMPGDLIFFTDKKGHKKITHVGIVTEVKGKKEVKFIHASTKLGVVEENLYSEWYLPLFIKGVRIF